MAKTDYLKYQKGCKHLVTHGMSKTPTYRAWSSMMTRCYNPNNAKYPIYGGRGIEVFKPWHKFKRFLKDMGKKPDGLSLDRIDSDQGYFPENCRWATQRQQQNNRTNNMLIEWKCEALTAAEWERRTGIPYGTIRYRIKAGWSAQRALTEPVRLGKNQFG